MARPELVSKSLDLQTSREIGTKREVSFVASTDALDSYEEIVEQDWDLERFKSNPIVLYGHQSRELPIGKATRVEVVSVNGRRQLETTIEFVSEKANPKAEQVWQLIKEGVLKAVSVGFLPRNARYEKRDGREVFVLGSPELHEVSVVPIPANPEALAKMKAKALAAAGNDNQPAPAAATEKTMKTIEEYAAALAKSGAELELAQKSVGESNKEIASLKTALSTFESSVKSLTTDRDAWKDRAEKAESVVVDGEVEALVGVKITTAQKGEFLELRKSNPELFKRMVAALPDMKLLKGAVIGDAKATSPAVTNGETGNGAGLANKIFGG